MTETPDQKRYVLPQGQVGIPALYEWFPGITEFLDDDGNFVGGSFGRDDDRAMRWPQAKAALLIAVREMRDGLNAEIAYIDTVGPDILAVRAHPAPEPEPESEEDTRLTEEAARAARDRADAEALNHLLDACDDETDQRACTALVHACGDRAATGLYLFLTSNTIRLADWPIYIRWAADAYKGWWITSGAWARDTFTEALTEATARLPYGLDWAQFQPWPLIAERVAARGDVTGYYDEGGVHVFDLTNEIDHYRGDTDAQSN